jgi:hypothetical protein
MAKNDDGGPAFPALEINPWGKPHTVGGMCLRDYFAAKAIGAAYLLEARRVGKDGFPEGRAVAEFAYILADEMLAVR